MNSFYKKYHQSLRNYISKKIDDPDIIENLVHDVLLSAFNSLATFRQESSEFTWIIGIANHKIIDYYRKKKLKTILFSVSPVFEDIADASLSPERDALKNELKQEIKNTLSKLNKGYQRIIRLKYINGFKLKDISAILKLNLKATESLLIRARLQFQKKWTYDKTSFSYRHSPELPPASKSLSSGPRARSHSK